MNLKKVPPIQDRVQIASSRLMIMDQILQSLAGIHEDYAKEQDAFHKKISVRKLALMEELYDLTSPLS